MSTRGFTAGVLLFVVGMLCGMVALWYLLGGLERWHSERHAPLSSSPATYEVVIETPPATTGRPADAPVAVSPAEPARPPPPLPPSPEPAARYQSVPDSVPEPAPAPEPTQPTRALNLIIPVQGIAAAQLQDAFNDLRSEGRRHQAIDIMAARGAPVLAVEAGRIVKLFESKQGGLTVYQFDPQDELAYYYAHLDRYAEGLIEGQAVAQGEVIGYVGHSGNASPSAPHLHFAIFQLGAERRWWQGAAINPYPHLVHTLDAKQGEGQ